MLALFAYIETWAYYKEPNNRDGVLNAATQIGYFKDTLRDSYKDNVIELFLMACEPLRHDGDFDFKNSQLNSITWSDYRKSSKIIKKAIQYAYEILDPDKKQEYIISKQRAINRSIEDYLSKKSKGVTDSQDNIRELLTYILGHLLESLFQ